MLRSTLLSCAAALVLVGGVEGTARCETGWAKASGGEALCFLDAGLAAQIQGSRWGWSNHLAKADLPVTLEVWGGAADCNTGNGILQGHVEVRLAANGDIEIEVLPLATTTLNEVHIWVGDKLLPQKQVDGQLKFVTNGGDFLDKLTQSPWGPVSYSVAGSMVYVAVHTDGCTETCVAAGSTTATVKVDDVVLTPIDPATDLEWLVEGDKAVLSRFPTHLQSGHVVGYTVHDQTVTVEVGSSIEVTCPDNCEGRACAVTLVRYHCPPCSGPTNGGLITHPRVSVGSCATQFHVGMAGPFEMVSYHALVHPGETFDFAATSKPLRHFAVLVSHGEFDCGAFDETACNAHVECAWEAGECVSSWCPPVPVARPQGPAQCICAPPSSS